MVAEPGTSQAAGLASLPRMTGPDPRARSGQLIVGLAIMAGMMLNMPSILGATFSLFLKPVSGELGWGREEMSLAVLLGQIITTPIYPLVGSLADRKGSRAVVLPGMALFGLSVIALSLTSRNPVGFDILFIVSSLIGTLVSGVVFGRGVASTFSKARGRALGICLGVGGGIGATLSPVIANGLIGEFGWRGAYIGLGALPIVIGLPTMIFLYRPGPAETSIPRKVSTDHSSGLGEAVRSPILWAIWLIIFFGCLANNGILVHLAALLTDKGLTGGNAAVLVSTVAIATSVGQIGSGFLLDKVGRPLVGIPFACSLLLGMLLLHFAVTPAMLTLGVALFGFGIGSEYSLIPYYLTRYFGVGSFGKLYGAIYASASIGGGLGPYVMGLTFDRVGSYHLAMGVFEIGLLTAIGLMLLLPAYRHPVATA